MVIEKKDTQPGINGVYMVKTLLFCDKDGMVRRVGKVGAYVGPGMVVVEDEE